MTCAPASAKQWADKDVGISQSERPHCEIPTFFQVDQRRISTFSDETGLYIRILLWRAAKSPARCEHWVGGPPINTRTLHGPAEHGGGKAPCIDRIPIEFFKDFWNEMGEDPLTVFNEI